MPPANGLPDEMRPTTTARPGFDPLSLDPSTAGRILAGLAADDAPAAYAPVARLLDALRAPALDEELAGEAAALAAFAAVGPHPAPPPRTWASVRRFGRFGKVKVAVASVVGGLSLTTGLAAAGALPGPAQGLAADALAHVGITVPNPDTDARGGDAPKPAPAPAKPADNHGAEVSDTARTTDAEGREKGAEVSDTASNGKSRAGEDRPAPTPAPTTPDPAKKPAEPPAKGKGAGRAGR